MAFVALKELSGSSKVAIFIVCVGNIIFTVVGIAVILLGAYFTVRENVSKFISSYIAGSTSSDVSGLVDNTTYQFIVTLCIILMATGTGITIISMIGFCGAVQRNQHCMLGYVVFLVILVVAQSGSLAFFGAFKAKIDSQIQTFVRERVANEYAFGQDKITGLTAAFDFIQMEYDCCGVVGSSDYAKEFSGWRDSYPDESGGLKSIPIPPFCCKFKNDKKLTFVEIFEIENRLNWTFVRLNNFFQPFFLYPTCLDNSKPNVLAAWTNKGCYRSFVQRVLGNLTTMLLSCSIGIVLFEVVCLLFSCVLLCDVKTVKSYEDKQIELTTQLKMERDTILAGIHATASLGAAAMTEKLSMLPPGQFDHLATAGPNMGMGGQGVVGTPMSFGGSGGTHMSMAGIAGGMPGTQMNMGMPTGVMGMVGPLGGMPMTPMIGTQGGMPGATMSLAGMPGAPMNFGGMPRATMSLGGTPGAPMNFGGMPRATMSLGGTPGATMSMGGLAGGMPRPQMSLGGMAGAQMTGFQGGMPSQATLNRTQMSNMPTQRL